MAKTTVATGATNARVAYDEKLFRDARKSSFFDKFMGENASSMVQVKSDLEKNKGETVKFSVRMRLAGAGVTEGQVLEGNEEALTFYTNSVTLAQYRHAVRDDGEMDRQRTAYDIDEEAKAAIMDWGAEKIDALCFNALLSSPTKTFYLDSSGVVAAGSAATAKSGLHATSSKITPAFIRAIKTWAKTGGNRSYIPLRPIRIKGKDYYVLLTHPDCVYDLKNNSTYEAYVREAAERSDENPLFTGAVAIVDGVVIQEHENCTIALDGGGGSVAWAKGAFLGQQALLWAWGKRPKTIEKDFDYEDQIGHAWKIVAGVTKPIFNSLDYGSLGVYLSRTSISGL